MKRAVVRARSIGSGQWLRWKYTCNRHPAVQDVNSATIISHLKARHRIGMADVLREMEAARLREP